MGAAFDRVITALDKAGRQPRVYGSGKATAHCPGPGHYRDDRHPSLTITPGDGCALVYCHALSDGAVRHANERPPPLPRAGARGLAGRLPDLVRGLQPQQGQRRPLPARP
jgi:hypothetical protein